MIWRICVGVVSLGILTGCERDGLSPLEPAPAPKAKTDPVTRSLNDSFEEATTAFAPRESLPPVDVTKTGKRTAELYQKVRQTWDQTKFQPGQTITVVLDTDLGEIELALQPDLAPNHCRQFLTLTKIGYYDGLAFERIVRQEVSTADGVATRIEFVTAGCPIAQGTPGLGHLGYFLKPEFNTLTHDEGTVGFWRGDSEESAGTRFYLTVGRSPVMDGHYTAIGTVTKGRELLRKLGDQPTQPPEHELPETPTTIRSVRLR